MNPTTEMRQHEQGAQQRTLRVAVPACVLFLAAALVLLAGNGSNPGHTPLRMDIPSWPASAALVQHPQRATLTLRFRPGVSSTEQQHLLARYGATESGSIPELGLKVVSVAPAKARALLHRLRRLGQVAAASPDDVRQIAGAVSDPAFSSQWALAKIGWNTAHRLAKPKRHVTIAIVDTGVDGAQADLAGRLVPGYSAFASSNPTTDPNGHGTWMASIAAARTGNGVGIAGVDFAHARIMPVQVLNERGYGLDSDIVKGVLWAADHGANVILMSFAGPGYSPALQAAVDYAWSKGAVVVAAAGNNGSSAATFPAGDAHVVGVSATDSHDHLWSGSNYGPAAFIAAPGVGIPADAVGGGTTSVTGTSASAALVAGSAALLLSANPKASNRDVVGLLAQSAAHAGTREQTGNGRLDLGRAFSIHAPPAVPAGVLGRERGGPFSGPYLAAASTASNPTVVGTFNGTGAVTLSPTAAVPVGSTLFLIVGEATATATGNWTATDNLGTPNTYTQDIQETGTVRGAIIRATITTALATSNTIMITPPVGGVVRKAVTALYFKGLITGSPLDKTGVNAASSAAETVTSAATTQAIELVVASMASAKAPGAATACTPSTGIGTGNSIEEEPMWMTVTTTGAKTCATAVGNGAWADSIATYKVDTTVPMAAITFPSAAAYNATGWTGATNIAGTASDTTGGAGVNSAVASDAVSIRDNTLNEYWTGAAWSAPGAAETYNAAAGTTNWTYAFSNANLINGHSYTVHATSTDDATNVSNVQSQTFMYDTTAPTNAFSLQSVSTYSNAFGTFPVAYYSGAGTNIYYDGSAGAGAQTFKIRAAVTDTGGSGGASVTTSSFANGGSNMTHTDATTSTPGGGNFDTNVYSFTPATSGTATSSILSTDVAGNNSTGTGFSLVNDNAGPTGGAVTVNGTAASGGGSTSYVNTGSSVTINSRTDYNTDATSVSTATLDYKVATLGPANACGSYGASTNVPPATTTIAVSTGNCYLFTLTGVDALGNSSTITTTVKVDTTAPSNPTYTLSEPVSDGQEYESGSTLFFNPAAAGNHTFRATASTSDGESDIADVTFSAPSGLTCVVSCAVDTTSPYTQDYTWNSSTASAANAKIGQAHNNAGGASTQTGITLTSDSTAPTNTITFPTAATYNSTGWAAITGHDRRRNRIGDGECRRLDPGHDRRRKQLLQRRRQLQPAVPELHRARRHARELELLDRLGEPHERPLVHDHGAGDRQRLEPGHDESVVHVRHDAADDELERDGRGGRCHGHGDLVGEPRPDPDHRARDRLLTGTQRRRRHRRHRQRHLPGREPDPLHARKHRPPPGHTRAHLHEAGLEPDGARHRRRRPGMPQ